MRSLRAGLIIGFSLAAGGAFATGSIDVEMNVKVSGAGQPLVSATTNLPDGTSLIVSILDNAGVPAAQDKVTVSAGRLKAGLFSDSGHDLLAGHYQIKISSAAAEFQSSEVQAAIGDHGQALRGPLVHEDRELNAGRVVEAMTDLTIR